MTSSDVKITIDSSSDIVESSIPPFAHTPVDRLLKQIMSPAFNCKSEIMESSKHGSAASSPASERPSKEVSFLDNEMKKLVDERQRRVDEMQRRVDEMQRLIAGEDRWSIPKVPYRLREVKQKAYEPNAISIGPYHYDKEHLRAMDVVKRSSFANIVKRTKLELKEFVKSMILLKERALNCYERPIHADLESDDNFMEMMVYDGCFIVQLIRDMNPPELAKLPRHIQNDMWDDLLLVENQLPFFVLLELDRIIMGNDGGGLVKFEKEALSSFVELDAYTLNIFPKNISEPSSANDIKHLLDMVHKCCRPSPQGRQKHKEYLFVKEAERKANLSTKKKEEHEEYIETKKAEGSIGSSKKHLLDMVTVSHRSSSQVIKKPVKFSSIKKDEHEAKGSLRSGKFMRSATELNNARIDFLGAEENSLLDVTFTNHTRVLKLKFRKKLLKIPTLYVRKNTERRLRNLMAYEQFTPIKEPTYISDYVMLMDNLVDTGEDVKLLRTSGAIENRLADDEAVACMFNELGDSTYSNEDFYYAEIVGKVNQHCEENTRLAKWNKSITNLNRDYFSSPWSVCSFLAAVILLVTTILQTTYTFISYYHPS